MVWIKNIKVDADQFHAGALPVLREIIAFVNGLRLNVSKCPKKEMFTGHL